MKKLGIDIGSIALHSVIINENGEIESSRYVRHNGDIYSALQSLHGNRDFSDYTTAGFTGTRLTESLPYSNTVLAQSEGASFLLPGVRSVISIGGETFSLIRFDESGKYKEHSINPPCASGTGSFLDQQASRLTISIEELAQRASEYTGSVPSIATRCSVFAKTDIIHAMQEGFSRSAVCTGLCEGIARNIIDVLVKGRSLTRPVLCIGGVSRIEAIRQGISSFLNIPIEQNPYSHLAGAVGAALLGEEISWHPDLFKEKAGKSGELRPPLILTLSDYPNFNAMQFTHDDDVEILTSDNSAPPGEGNKYLGIDIGSTSTKAVIISENGEFHSGFYTYTQGKPIEAVQKILKKIRHTLGNGNPGISGAASTGSGRKIIGELFRCDSIIDEITAHAKAAVRLTPEADTIIEIGGQDSKFTRIRNGNVYYSTMNYVCAAGTGSFLEEQAKRLNLSLDEFSDKALGAEAPYTSDRCTVYMEKDIGRLLSEGWPVDTLAAAVLYSVRDNYLSKVVGKSPLGEYIVFQGATGRNKALVAAFEQKIGKPVHVSPLCHLTGALGAALHVLEEAPENSVFSFNTENFRVFEEICDICANRCRLTVAETETGKTGWGMKCGSEYESRKPKKERPPEIEKRYEEALSPLFPKTDSAEPDASFAIGIPDTLYNRSYSPLWADFFNRLGYNTLVIRDSRKILSQGKELVNSDFCAPMIYAHGSFKACLERGADYLFFPALINEECPERENILFKQKNTDAYFCYYSQYLPAIMEKLPSFLSQNRILSPLIRFGDQSIEEISDTVFEEIKIISDDITREKTHSSLKESVSRFRNQRKSWQEKAWKTFRNSKNPIRIILLGRPYVVFNSELNQHIAEKLEMMGADVFWMEELALENHPPSYGNKFLERMHWHYGKDIIRAADFAAREEGVFIIYLTCFRCSPDSFLLTYVKDIFDHYDKPFLVLQLDEHGSDVGYETRIEAGLNSFRNSLMKKEKPLLTGTKTSARNDSLSEGDTVLIPYLDSLISSFWAACFERAGHKAVLLEANEKSLNTGYQYANGGECMPLVSIIGGAIEGVKDKALSPSSTYLYLPSLCLACNFPQFPILADAAFQKAFRGGIKIGLVNTMSPGEILPQSLAIKMLESNIIGSIIYKLYFRIKPYERIPGAADAVFANAGSRIRDAIINGADLKECLARITEAFADIERDEEGGRKPRIGLLGDLYVKFNEVVNQNLVSLVHQLKGELVIPSMTEYPFHFYHADIRLYGESDRSFRMLKLIEGRYEKIAGPLLDNRIEPDFEECAALSEAYGIRHYIAGETAINIGRALYMLENNLVDAIIHINPMFCCPGVVSSSIFRKIQEDYGKPVIDIFYDGTGNPNSIIIPHLHYLHEGLLS